MLINWLQDIKDNCVMLGVDITHMLGFVCKLGKLVLLCDLGNDSVIHLRSIKPRCDRPL